eukprot:scaffold91197_cov63-Phaeocystis_antarctica.AAC.2
MCRPSHARASAPPLQVQCFSARDAWQACRDGALGLCGLHLASIWQGQQGQILRPATRCGGVSGAGDPKA